MAPPQKDSVHRYFSYNEASKCSKCNLCEKIFKTKHTSNLKSHLASKHMAEFQIVREINKNNLHTTISPQEIRHTKLIEQIKKICMRLVTEHGRPFNMIEDTAFQELLSLAFSKNTNISLIKQIHVKAVEATVHEQADLIRNKIWSEIKNKLVCIKLDSLTCAERKFLGFNIQYIKNGRIVVRNLAVHEVHEPQTGSFLKSALKEVLTDFRIGTENLYCICTDNGENMIKTVKLLGGRYFIDTDTGPNRANDEEEGINREESDEEEIEEENEDCSKLKLKQENGDENMEVIAGEEERSGYYFFSTEQEENEGCTEIKQENRHGNMEKMAGEEERTGDDFFSTEQEENEGCTKLKQENSYENMDEMAGEEERTGDDFFSTKQDFNAQNLVSITDFSIRGMLCAAHTLQLAVKDAIAENLAVVSLLNTARRIVHILRSPNNTHALKTAHQRKAIIDCPTRWTSTYNMLKRLLAIRDFISTIKEVSLLVSPVFWTQLTAIIECLKPANEATIKLQSQDLTIGDFYITWATCKNFISLIDHDFATSLVRAMQAREIQLLNNDVVLEALYVDRRLNVILNDHQCAKARALLKETYQKLQNLNQNEENMDGEGNTEENQQSDAIAVPSTSQGTLALEAHLIRAERARGSCSQERSFDFCLNELVIGSRVPVHENIIKHWSNAAVLGSDVAMVANTVLAAPSTQVSVERLCSSLKFILNPLRSNLSRHLLRDIMLIRQNKDLID